jgi:hypothetical protein
MIGNGYHPIYAYFNVQRNISGTLKNTLPPPISTNHRLSEDVAASFFHHRFSQINFFIMYHGSNIVSIGVYSVLRAKKQGIALNTMPVICYDAYARL